MPETLYLIDVFSLVFQVYHAIRSPMSGSRGQPTNAVYGFTRDLQNIIFQQNPTHLVCALDSEGPGIRNDWYPEYKANRSEMPADLRPQIQMVKDVIEGFRIPGISMAGWEADDVIATYTRLAVERGMQVRIISSDKDLRQLLGPQVQILNMRKNLFYDESALEADWGIRPEQVIDFQALVGDSVDNIPGVPLVGPKKAKLLLEKFGSFESVLANAEKAPGKKLQENLRTGADLARTSRRLVTLNQELDLAIDWEAVRVCEPDTERLLELYDDFGFRTFSQELRQGANRQATPAEAVDRKWEKVDTPAKLKAFVAELQNQHAFCVDLETTGLDATRADIVGWAFSWEPHCGYYIPVLGPDAQTALDPQMVLDTLKPLLENPEILVSNQNIKYDMLVLKRVGVNLKGIGTDPMVGHYLLDAGARSHGLDTLAGQYLNHQMIPISDLIGKGKTQKKMFEVDINEAAEYASEDADIAWQLSLLIEAGLKQEQLWELYWDLERPLIPVLVEMEHRGIRVDVEELQTQSAAATVKLETLVAEIYEIAGHEFNIDSPKQLRTVLFEELNLPVIKKTKTGPSTAQNVLEQLAPMHPLPEKITAHRHLSKLRNTYLDALPKMVNPDTGRIHCSFNQVVAATGRLSSSEPNLQNIPIRTEEGRQVRKAFIPGEPGWKLLCADYSQIELRMLAHFSNDTAMTAAFENDIDIHTAVAAEIYGVTPEAVDSDMRRVAKAVNFGVIYGQSSFGLANALGIEQDAAAAFIEGYFAKYDGVVTFMDELLTDCRNTRYATTILGRRREITGIRDEPTIQRNLPERTAINTVIQGSAADLIKKAMINVQNRLMCEKHPGHLLLQIHDELVFEVPEAEVASLVQLVREEMQNAMELTIPLVVDVSVGDNWLEKSPVAV